MKQRWDELFKTDRNNTLYMFISHLFQFPLNLLAPFDNGTVGGILHVSERRIHGFRSQNFLRHAECVIFYCLNQDRIFASWMKNSRPHQVDASKKSARDGRQDKDDFSPCISRLQKNK